jgi:hypothetical protein
MEFCQFIFFSGYFDKHLLYKLVFLGEKETMNTTTILAILAIISSIVAIYLINRVDIPKKKVTCR